MQAVSALFCVGQSSVAQPALFTSWHSSRLASAVEQPALPAPVKMLWQKSAQLGMNEEVAQVEQTRPQAAEASGVAPPPVPKLLLDGAVDGALDDLPAAADTPSVPASASSWCTERPPHAVNQSAMTAATVTAPRRAEARVA
jgi:hypothetical protein